MSGNILSWLSKVKFWVLIFLSIPSSICSILILIYFYHQRRNITIHHHLIFVLIIISILQITTYIPVVINFYQQGKVTFESNIFCIWWNCWEYSLNGSLLFVMAWSSIERHLINFHSQIMATRRKRFIFHILPMLITGLYPPIFYFIFMILDSCNNQWNYETVLCSLPCFLIGQPILVTYVFLGNIVFPIFVIVIANIHLILRVLWQKRRHRVAWHRQYKLTKQLMFMAMLYMIFWFPLTINGLMMNFASSSSTSEELQVNYFAVLIYLVPILLPFISLTFLSNFVTTVLKRRLRTVAPLTLHP